MSVNPGVDPDQRPMALALEAAARGRPSPNPHVGAVVVQGDEVVAVGHHERAGLDHAEVAALRQAGDRSRGATLYCTLEPCNHHGRTPPCTDAILAAQVARVVVGCPDPAPHVPGALDRLRAAGIEVRVGVREAECRAVIADFAHHIQTGRPYAVLKAAVTLDGRLAARTGDSRWVTGPEARAEAHRRRDRADAVLVGVGTVLADDPALTVRHVAGRDPIRIVLDTHLRTPPEAALVRHASGAPTWILHGPDGDPDRMAALSRRGVELLEVPVLDGRIDLEAALDRLGARDIVRLLVEGGSEVHGALLTAGLYRRAVLFIAPKILGDGAAFPLASGATVPRMADAWRLLPPVRVERLGDDLLVEGDLAHGPDAAEVSEP